MCDRRACLRADEFDSAELVWRAVLAVDGEDAEALKALAQAATATGDLDAAETYYERMASGAQTPTNIADALEALATLHFDAERYEQGVDTYRRLAALEHCRRDAWMTLERIGNERQDHALVYEAPQKSQDDPSR